MPYTKNPKSRDEAYKIFINPMKYRRYYDSEKDTQDIPGFPPRTRKQWEIDKDEQERRTDSSGPLDAFITPDVFDWENCSKCHHAPRNEAWNIYCKKCGERGLLSRPGER